MGDLGCEDDWMLEQDEVSRAPDEPLAPQAAVVEDSPAAPATSGEALPPFHEEFRKLCAVHGLDDFFYVARSKDGKEEVLTWQVSADPKAAGYRDRVSRLYFEVMGVFRHMEESWTR